MAARLEPVGKRRQERLERLLVADQVVVDEIDMAAISKLIEGFEFDEHLRCCLGAWHTAVQFDDVTELAGERARQITDDAFDLAVEPGFAAGINVPGLDVGSGPP